MKNCSNCGGRLVFSPIDKGNKCESCGSITPIKYEYKFVKKDFAEAVELDAKSDNFAKTVKKINCKSCGASVLLEKFQAQTYCPYCGNTQIAESKNKKLIYIDSIIPFSFGKVDALKKFKQAVKQRFYANKRIFKRLSPKDINGAYINAFVFDFDTVNIYSGVLSYRESVKDDDGNTTYVTRYKNVSGTINKKLQNITIEANSNLQQYEINQVMPFEYGSAVNFKDDFMHGYMLEYQNQLFSNCVNAAEKIVEQNIRQTILSQHDCDDVVELKLNTKYNERKYNYCLLPVYFVSTKYKDKQYKQIMNGQTGKVGHLPTDPWRVVITVLLVFGVIGGLILLCLLT